MNPTGSSPFDETAPSPIEATVRRERSYPLVALLQLATYWAAIVACVDGPTLAARVDDARDEPLIAASALAAALAAGALIGFALGLGQLRKWRSAFAGAAVGMLYGVAILAVYMAPAPIAQALAAAAVLMVTTIAFRAWSA